jgi:hypothetical protein
LRILEWRERLLEGRRNGVGGSRVGIKNDVYERNM